MMGQTLTGISRVGEGRGFIKLGELGGVNERVPNDDDTEGGRLGSLEGVDGVSLLAQGVTSGEGGREDVPEEFR
jgi:hypothetical protein